MFETRTAPRNGRLNRPSPGQLAVIDDMVARASAFSVGGRMTALSTEPAPGQADPTPEAPPNTPLDTAARLDAQDAQLQDHEARIAALEERSPPPSGLNDGVGGKPAEPAAAAAPKMILAGDVYARMTGRPAGPKAAPQTPPMPAMIQTSSGPVLNAGAIIARNNALATARTGRPSARARG